MKNRQNILVFAYSFLLGLSASHILLPINRAEATTTPVDTVQTSTSQEFTSKSAPEKTENAEISAKTPSGSTIWAQTVQSTTQTKAQIAQNQAQNQNQSQAQTLAQVPQTGLYIPSIGLSTGIAASSLVNSTPTVPSSGASQYGSLIMGHVFGVFANISALKSGQKLYLNGASYTITSVEPNLPVSSDRKNVGPYTMNQLIYRGQNLVLMTCAGTYSSALNTYSHRTLIFANRD